VKVRYFAVVNGKGEVYWRPGYGLAIFEDESSAAAYAKACHAGRVIDLAEIALAEPSRVDSLMLSRWRARRERCLSGVTPTLAELEAAMPRWTTEVVTQEAAPAGSAMRRAIDAGQHVIGMLWKHSEALRERIDLATEKADAVLAAPDSDGAALRSFRNWIYGERRGYEGIIRRIRGRHTSSGDGDTTRFEIAEELLELVVDEADRRLAARQDTPCSSDSSASSDSMTTEPAITKTALSEPATAAGSSPSTEPAREPDEIEAWSAKAGTAPIDEKGNTRYESDPRCRGTEYSRYVLCRSEIDDALAIMRRLRDERDDAEQAVREVTDSKNGAYRERDQLVCALSKLFPSWLGKHPENETWDHDWRTIVFVQLPTGQCSWHIHDSEAAMFSHLSRGSTAWDGHTTEEKYRRLAALRAARPAPTSERVKQLRAKLEKAIDGLVGESLNPSGNSGNSDLDRLPLHDANREVEHYLDELCEFASNPILVRVAEPAGDGALRKAAKALMDSVKLPSPNTRETWDRMVVPCEMLVTLRDALAAQEPAEESDLVRTLRLDLDDARANRDKWKKEAVAARAEARRLAREEFSELPIGAEFTLVSGAGQGHRFRKLREYSEGGKESARWIMTDGSDGAACFIPGEAACIVWHEALESQAKPESAQEPVWSEPNDHTKNVCAIRRRSDGYWWQCNSEHGAGWDDKRIRQAWTAREARLEVERHLQGQDVEIVQLMPEPKPEAAAATDAEREGDAVLSRWLALDKSLTQLEWLAAMSVVVDELCRRALRGGNHGSL